MKPPPLPSFRHKMLILWELSKQIVVGAQGKRREGVRQRRRDCSISIPSSNFTKY